MKYRKLGRDGPSVSAIGMDRGSRPVRAGDPLEQAFNSAIRRAYELGINFFDSSDAYWGTRHEVLLGAAVKSSLVTNQPGKGNGKESRQGEGEG